jgi:hypothetical protein
MKKIFREINERRVFMVTILLVSLVISVVSVEYFFLRDYGELLEQVKKKLINFSDQKENLVSQFLLSKGSEIQFIKNTEMMEAMQIADKNGEISMNGIRTLLYVERPQKMRLNAYLVNSDGALLTANEDFDKSTDRNTKIIRNDLINDCLNQKGDMEKFYTGIDEGNRSVFGTYKKVSSLLPLCLFSETEKVTNIDVPAQNILKRYIFFGLIFVAIMTFLGGYFSSFSSAFTLEELLLFVLCGVACLSFSFMATLVTRGVNYFSVDSHFLEVTMATFSFSLLIIVYPLKKCKSLKLGALILGIYFLAIIFFEEYRQAFALSSTIRNFILVLMKIFGIYGFLLLFFDFKKNAKYE